MDEKLKNIFRNPRAVFSRLSKIALMLFPISYVVFALLVSNWFPFATDEESIRHILEWLVILAAGISIIFLLSLLPLKNTFWPFFTLFAGIAFLLVFGIAYNSSIQHPIGTLTFLSGFYAIGCALLGVLAVAFFRWVLQPRHFQKFLFGCTCVATLIALFYAEENWRGKHDWEKFKREWEAKGEKFDFKDFIPPPVSDEQNFAMAPIFDATDKLASRKWRNEHRNQHPDSTKNPWDTNLVDRLQMDIDFYGDNGWPTNGGNWQLAKLTDLKERQNYYRALATKTNLFPIAPQPQTPAQDVLLALSKYDPAIEELRQASQLPYARFPLDYNDEDPAEILLPHLADLKRCSQVLRLRATAELQNGQSDKALDDVKLSFRLIDSIRTEPIIISHLVRIAMTAITLLPIYEGLAEHRWSDAQLAELDSELGKLDFLADYEFSMRGERTFGIATTEYLRRTRNLRAMGFDDQGDPSSPPFSNLGFHLTPSSFFYRSELTMARMHQQWTLPLVNIETRIVSPKNVSQNTAAADRELQHGWPYNILARMIFPAIGNAVKKFAYAQSSVDLARVAVALERYRLAHGEFPELLDALAPQFMEKIPHDIINGEPLHYRRTDDGQFVLYSVGWNETDDGGVVGLNKSGGVNYEKGDWVWRYPQK